MFFYGEEEFDAEEEEEPEKVAELPTVKLNFTDKMPPGSGETDWEPMRQALIDHRVSKGRNPNGTKIPPKPGVTIESGIHVTERGHEILVADMPQSPRGYAKRASACRNCPHPPERHPDGVCNVRACECAGYSNFGWEIKAQRSSTHNEATLYVADSKAEEGKDGHSIGDVNTPAEDREHYGLAGVLMNQGQVFAAFELTYEGRPKGDKMVPAFSCARWRDEISGVGFSMVAGDFGEWFDIFVPPTTERKERKTLEEKRDAKLAAPIESGEWTG